MIAIEPRDKPKLIAIGVALVFVTGFVGKTALSALPSAPPQAKPPAEAPVLAPTAARQEGPETLAVKSGIQFGTGPVNPFREVLPDPREYSSTSAPDRGVPVASANLAPLPLPSAGGIAPVPITGVTGVPSHSLPAAPVHAVLPGFRLDGVVARGEASALITVDGRTDLYRPGQRVAGVYKITAITPDGARFSGPKGSIRLEVGDTLRPVGGSDGPLNLSQG